MTNLKCGENCEILKENLCCYSCERYEEKTCKCVCWFITKSKIPYEKCWGKLLK